MVKNLTLIILISFFSTVSFSQSGSLYSGFGTGGTVLTNFGTSTGEIRAVAVQADGKILVAGSSYIGNPDITVHRYNADGSLDINFDSDGRVTTAIGFSDDNAYAMALQADGKIVVAGRSWNGSNWDFAVLRYNDNGSLDVTFDIDGKLTTAVGTGDDQAFAVAIDADNKIIVAGHSFNGSNRHFAVVRYTTNGTLDNTFDTDGKQITVIGSTSTALDIAIQPADGKIVLAGRTDNPGVLFAVARYNTNGLPDNNFDGDGYTISSIGSGLAVAYSVVIQTDGTILTAGSALNNGNSDFALIRYNNDGSFDNNFDTDGKVLTAIGANGDEIRDIILQADGKILATGYAWITGNDFAIARYNSNGSLDNTFDTDGYTTTAFSGDDKAYGIGLLTGGNIIIAGTSNSQFAIAAYTSSGSPYNTFDTDGKLTEAVGLSYDIANAVAIQTNGKIIAAGQTWSGTYMGGIVRYNTDGSLDNSFSGDGKIINTYFETINSAAVQTDGKILVAGFFEGIDYEFAIARYNSDGTPDITFGPNGDGTIRTSIGPDDDHAYALAIQADGKIIQAGSVWDGSDFNFGLLRYNTNGTLDATFDGDGKVTTAIGTSWEKAFALAIQSDGKIVAAGTSWNGSNYDYAVVRYNTNGSLDNTFDSDGKLTTAIGSSNELATSIAIQTDGKIVCGGVSFNTKDNFAVVRYNTNGSPDLSFDNDGIVTTSIGSGADYSNAIAIASDGKIILAGRSYNGSNDDFAIVKYNSNGGLDGSFDTDGKVTTAIGGYNSINAIKISGNRIIAAGYSETSGVYDFALAAYQNTTVFPGYTHYYSKSTGELSSTNTWGTNVDGSGTPPSNFTDHYQVFNLVNRTGTVNMTGEAGSITLGGLLLLDNSITLNAAGKLTIKSDVTGTGAIGPVPSASTITGNVTVERFIGGGTPKQAWSLLTSPLKTPSPGTSTPVSSTWQVGGSGQGTFITGPSGTGLDATTPGYSMKSFDMASQTLTGVSNTTTTPLFTSDPGSNLAANKSYFIFVYGDRSGSPPPSTATNTTLLATGELQVGTIKFTTNATAETYTLVGNPYASRVDLNKFRLTNNPLPDNGTVSTNSNIKTNYYYWDPYLGSYGGYVTVSYDAAGEESIVPAAANHTRFLQSGQAMFVETRTDATGVQSVQFMEHQKDATTVSNFTRTNASSEGLAINLSSVNNGNAALIDGVLASFSNSYSASVDNYDASKLFNTGESLALTRSTADLSIERRPPVIANDTLFLKVTSIIAGKSYRLNFSGSFDHTNIIAFLQDSYNPAVITPVSVTGNTSYDFSVTADPASAASNRFRIIFTSTGPLPLSFTNVKAYQQNSGIAIEWQTANEIRMKVYEVQRSVNSIGFSSLHTAAARNSSSALYSWVDHNPVQGDNYYRIRSIGIDGEVKYSNVVRLFIGKGKTGIKIYPNPVTDGSIHLQLTAMDKGNYNIRLINHLGQVVQSQQILHNGGSAAAVLNIGPNISPGIYELEITGPDDFIYTEKLIYK